MKINHYLDRSWFNGLRYTLHIMKIIIILLVLSIGNSFSMTYSQNTLLSLDINKQSIKEVIGIIEKKSEYVFFFSDNVRQDLEKSVDIGRMLCYTITCREGEDKEFHRNAICGSVGTGRRARLRIL